MQGQQILPCKVHGMSVSPHLDRHNEMYLLHRQPHSFVAVLLTGQPTLIPSRLYLHVSDTPLCIVPVRCLLNVCRREILSINMNYVKV